MFRRMLLGSLRHQRGRLGVAAFAVLLGATLTSALVNLSFDVSGQAGRQLRAYGANILVMPRGESAIDVASIGGAVSARHGILESDLGVLDGLAGVMGHAPYLFLIAHIQEQPVVVAGTRFDHVRKLSPWWRLNGKWPERGEEGLVGAAAAKVLGLKTPEQVTLRYGDVTAELTVAGTVETGGPEDSQVFVPLPIAQRLTGRAREVGLVQVSALASQAPLQDVTAAIEARLPGVEARLLEQVTRAEGEVLSRIRRLMALVAILVLTVAAITVGSTMVAGVLERRAEIGLMKALGARTRQVAALFLAEALSVGVAGGVTGYGAGLGLAALIGLQVFQADLSPTRAGLPITLAVAAGVTLLASLWPMRQALAVDPVVSLREE